MSNLHNNNKTTTLTLNLFRHAYITQSLIQLRQHLETRAPLDQLTIPADELLFRFLVAVDLPVETINQILGTEYPFS